jgi:hypothetical protein
VGFLGFGVWFMGFRVWCLGCGVWFMGFGVWGLGCGVWFMGFCVWGLGCGVWFMGFCVWWSLEFRRLLMQNCCASYAIFCVFLKKIGKNMTFNYFLYRIVTPLNYLNYGKG